MALSLTPDDRWRSTPGPAPASDDEEEEGRVGWLAVAATDEEEDAGRFAWIPAPLAPRTEALPTWLSRLARRFLSRVRVGLGLGLGLRLRLGLGLRSG